MYTLQRWTGGIAFAYIVWHVASLRFGPIDLHEIPGASFGVVQHELAVAWKGAFYMVGLLAASWHFSYGIWLFCAKWGIAVGEQARKKLLVVCLGLFLTLSGVGILSLRSFATHPQQPTQGPAAEAIESSR
jgi:succinate dehydrogenase / fumarate reductase cytochrome b subunit